MRVRGGMVAGGDGVAGGGEAVDGTFLELAVAPGDDVAGGDAYLTGMHVRSRRRRRCAASRTWPCSFVAGMSPGATMSLAATRRWMNGS